MPNFALLNYNDLSFIRNISFNSVWLIVFPTIFLLITLTERCASKKPKILKYINVIKRKCVEGAIFYVNSVYLVLVCAALIHTQHHKFDTAGNTFDSINSDFIILITFFLPLGGAWYVWKHRK